MHVELIRKDVKRINIKVKPTGEVVLTAPHDTSDAYIDQVLKRREKWINKHLSYFSNNPFFQEKQYVSGENFEYLGRNYRLKVVESDLEQVKLLQGYLHVFVSDKHDTAKKRSLIDGWYKEKASIHFTTILDRFKTVVKRDINAVKIRKMRTRWGSCNATKAYINLNLELIKKPRHCIEYVVLHELTHLLYPNHSQEFYNYLSIHMPDWQWRKDRLEHQIG